MLIFVDFIALRVEDQDEPMLSVADTLSGTPLSAKDIEEELYGDEKGQD